VFCFRAEHYLIPRRLLRMSHFPQRNAHDYEWRKKDVFCLERVGLAESRKECLLRFQEEWRNVGDCQTVNPSTFFAMNRFRPRPLTAITIDELIKEITDEYQITTVVITHDMNSVLTIGEYIMYLNQGNKLWEGDSKTNIQTTHCQIRKFVFSTTLSKLCRIILDNFILTVTGY
jgi:phospholipid/cholesterol/gamma-HCH transport system ATP-binding protein